MIDGLPRPDVFTRNSNTEPSLTMLEIIMFAFP